MRVLVGNSFSETLVGRYGRTRARINAQYALWHAEDGDVVVLPGAPDADFLDYALRMKGVSVDSVRVVVPPEDPDGDPRLTVGRLADPALCAGLRDAIEGRPVDAVVPLWPDITIARLAEAIGAADMLPGRAFLAQGGGAIVNSKAAFRALAAGNAVPIADGAVCVLADAAVDVAWAMVDNGRPVMLKGEYFTSGDGNFIVTARDDFRPLGARGMTVVRRRADVADFVAQQWERLTGGGKYRLVVEEYHPGCTSVFAEFAIGDSAVGLAGDGEMVKDPQGVAEIMPIQGRPDHLREQVIEGGRRLAEGLRAIGYRGLVSADAIVTPDERVYFTEYNGRITSSTHIYEVIGKRVVGSRYPASRVLYENVHLTVPSFAEALRRLRDAGLAFDPRTGIGVVLTSPYEERVRNVIFCSIGEDLAGAVALNDKVGALVAESM